MRSFKQDEAFEAVRAFNAMTKQLETFARYATGNPRLTVRAHASMTATTGDVMYIRPPLGLGVHREHHRSKCGKRDDQFKLICDACHKREIIDFYMFHEIAHVAFDSMKAHGKKSQSTFEDYLRKWHDPEACNHAISISGRRTATMSNIELASHMNEYMQTLTNAFEDVRVNEMTFHTRDGLRDIFRAHYRTIMEEEDVDLEGHVTGAQITQPRDAQFVIGGMLKAMDYNLDGLIVEEVQQALRDPRLEDLLGRAKDMINADAALKVAVEMFETGHDLGYLQAVQPCVKPEPEPPMPSLNNDPSEDESGDNDDTADAEEQPKGSPEGTPGEDSGDSDQQPEQSGESDDAGSGITGVGEEEPDKASGESDSEQQDHGSDVASSDHDESGPSEEGDVVQDDASGDEESSDGPASDEDRDDVGGREPSEHDSEDKDSGSDVHDRAVPGDDEGAELSDPGDAEEVAGDSGVSDDSGDEPDDGESEVPDESESEEDDEWPDSGDADSVKEFDSSVWDESKPGSDELDAETSSFNGPSGHADSLESLTPNPGTPDDVRDALERFGSHQMMDDLADGKLENVTGSPEGKELSDKLRDMLQMAITQAEFFGHASEKVGGLNMIPWPVLRFGHVWEDPKPAVVASFAPGQQLIARPLLILREAFDDNRRAKVNRNERSGRINSRVLGSRAPIGDDRLFGSRVIAARKSYQVCIALDCSNSTNFYSRSEKIKRAAYMQAEILNQLNIPFSMFGHSANGNFDQPFANDLWMYIQEVKGLHERWGDVQKRKLVGIRGVAWNLDGHAMEYARKQLDKGNATTRIILYYTDGDMPFHNFDEEKEILSDELEICRRKGYITLGVGINTDSPIKHGMNTVRIDDDSDIVKVAQQLTEALTGRKSR